MSVMPRQMEEMQKQIIEKQMNEMNAMQKQMMDVINIQKQLMQKQINEKHAVRCGPGPFRTTHNATAVNLLGLPTPPLLQAANEGMHTPVQEGRVLTSNDFGDPLEMEIPTPGKCRRQKLDLDLKLLRSDGC